MGPTTSHTYCELEVRVPMVVDSHSACENITSKYKTTLNIAQK